MKVIYLNKETGKEVHYGEYITYKSSKDLSNGYHLESETTMPIINETIPELIKQGLLVQKEVEDSQAKGHDTLIEEKLNFAIKAIEQLRSETRQLRALMRKLQK